MAPQVLAHPGTRPTEREAFVDKAIMAHHAPATLGQRIERGRRLYAEHADEIRFDSVEKVWLVPSQHDATSVYEVTLGSRGVYCECKDFEYRSPACGCVHIIAATLCKAKTFRCEGCGERFPNGEMFQVMDGTHLTFFEGDCLCRECAGWHGVL
jgi:hypothetical protein